MHPAMLLNISGLLTLGALYLGVGGRAEESGTHTVPVMKASPSIARHACWRMLAQDGSVKRLPNVSRRDLFL